MQVGFHTSLPSEEQFICWPTNPSLSQGDAELNLAFTEQLTPQSILCTCLFPMFEVSARFCCGWVFLGGWCCGFAGLGVLFFQNLILFYKSSLLPTAYSPLITKLLSLVYDNFHSNQYNHRPLWLQEENKHYKFMQMSPVKKWSKRQGKRDCHTWYRTAKIECMSKFFAQNITAFFLQ